MEEGVKKTSKKATRIGNIPAKILKTNINVYLED